MTPSKRLTLARMATLALATGLPALGSTQALAQVANYPNRPVRLIVSYGAGGSLDAMTRLLGQELGKILGQSFVVENIAGAGGTIGVKRVIGAAPDGYTLLMGITSDVALAPLTNAVAKYQSTDLVPVANIGTSGIVLIARPDLPANNLAELLQLAKSKPGQIRYGTSGTGSLPHVAMENINARAGTDIPLVPYKSASNITTDILGGHIDLAIVGLPALLPMIEQKKVIGEWADEHGLWVITDEIYQNLTYDGVRAISIVEAVPALADRTILVNGVAKTYAMTGWRVGWMVGPADAIKAAGNLQSHLSSNVSNISQRAAIAALNGPQDAAIEMREAFDRRRKLIVAELNKIPGLITPTPQGAFYVYPDVTGLLGKTWGGVTPTTSLELADLILDQAEVAVVPGEAFGPSGFVRLSYALGDAALLEGVQRLQRLFA